MYPCPLPSPPLHVHVPMGTGLDGEKEKNGVSGEEEGHDNVAIMVVCTHHVMT